MLSDQRSGSFKQGRRMGMGDFMLGPALQQGGFMSETPDQRRRSSNRAVNATAMRPVAPGAGFGAVGAPLSPTGFGSPAALSALFGGGYGERSVAPPAPPPQQGFGQGGQQPQAQQAQQAQQGNPLLQQLGMLLMAQRQQPTR